MLNTKKAARWANILATLKTFYKSYFNLICYHLKATVYVLFSEGSNGNH